MKNSMKIMIAALLLLLAANIIKWSGIMETKDTPGADGQAINSFTINYQQAGATARSFATRNIFNPPPAGYDFAKRASGAAVAAATVVPEKKWPQFKLTGIAESNGKKCAFISGPGAGGVYYEGSTLAETYTVTSIKAENAVVTDNETGGTKTFTLEGK